MLSIKDFAQPFDAIRDFESQVAQHTGSPYCVTTDSCSHAMEIAFRLTFDNNMVMFPAHTYLSVPMMLKKLNIPYMLIDQDWRGEYQFQGSNIWDSARRFEPGMYRPGHTQCLSFGRTKPLEIGRGGAILTDNLALYQAASRMRSDGRDLFGYQQWIDQGEFELGFHYNLRPEEAVQGLNLLAQEQFTEQREEFYCYPDLRQARICNYRRLV